MRKGMNSMFEHTYIAPLNAVKKEPGTGSYRGMRWRIIKDENGELQVTIYPEPKSFSNTLDSEKETKTFAFSCEGHALMVQWLEEQYNLQKERWENAPRI